MVSHPVEFTVLMLLRVAQDEQEKKPVSKKYLLIILYRRYDQKPATIF